MRPLAVPVAGVLATLGLVAGVSCAGGDDASGAGASNRKMAPDFSIPVVRAVGADAFKSEVFTLSEELGGGPFVLYFSYPG